MYVFNIYAVIHSIILGDIIRHNTISHIMQSGLGPTIQHVIWFQIQNQTGGFSIRVFAKKVNFYDNSFSTERYPKFLNSSPYSKSDI